MNANTSNNNNNAHISSQIARWESALEGCTAGIVKYLNHTKLPGDFILPFLEAYLAETYGDSLKSITDIIRRAKFNPKDVPAACYIIEQAEIIEPIFAQRLLLLKETKIMTQLEHERSRSDYLAYLLTCNAEDSKETSTKALNHELALIGKLLIKKYGQEGHRKTVLEYILKAMTYGDLAAKQFVVVYAIYLEEDYRNRFLPKQVTPDTPILVKPRRFVHFVFEILPEKIKKLKVATFSGALEFMNEVRPAYCMID